MALMSAALLAAASLLAQDPLLGWLDRLAQGHLDRREATFRALRTPGDARRRQEQVRRQLLESLGGLPEYRGPLNARRTGQLPGDGYVIEKLLFDSLPGVQVTANLYRPTAPGRYPAIAVPSGHTQEGKPEPQLLAANLARQGFIALTWDPIGQGEREQTYLPVLGRALSGGGGNEHLELGARSLLLGQSVARWFIHDARRALDYLESRPDVDPARLGVTGCSGGGAIATYLAALDPRVQAAAAGCFINTFRTLFTGPTPDSEMSLPAFLARGLDLADLFELRAPLPWLLTATEDDYFTPASARPVYEEVRRFYALLGAEDRVAFHVGPGPHGTPRESREAIYRWMHRWLKASPGDITEKAVKLYTGLELRVTPDGHAGGRKIWEVIHDEFRALRQPRGVPALRAELQRLGVPSTGRLPVVTVEGRSEASGYRVERWRIAAEPGPVPLSANFYLPDGAGRKPAVLVVEDQRLPVPLYVQRSPSTGPLAEAFVRAGYAVLELAPRDSPSALDGRPFLGNWLTNERADLAGQNLAALRAHDLLGGVDLLAAHPAVDADSLRAYARGVKGIWLLLAAAVDPRLKKLWLDRTPVRLATAFESPLTSHLFEIMLPGFARHWEIADLRQALDGRAVLWSDPANWMNEVIATGPAYRYRHVGEGDAPLVSEFLR